MSKQCRICYSEDDENNLISPCGCIGGSEFVHCSCLKSWFKEITKNDSIISLKKTQHCEICKKQYKFNDNSKEIENQLFIDYIIMVSIFIFTIILISVLAYSFPVMFFLSAIFICSAIGLALVIYLFANSNDIQQEQKIIFSSTICIIIYDLFSTMHSDTIMILSNILLIVLIFVCVGYYLQYVYFEKHKVSVKIDKIKIYDRGRKKYINF